MTRTNVFTLVCVVIRVAALWILLRLLVGLPGYIVAARNFPHPEEGNGAVYLLYGGVMLVAALFWLFADRIARLSLARPQDQVFESDLDARAWFGVALCAIGAWHFFAGLSQTVMLALRHVAIARALVDNPSGTMPDQTVAWMSTAFEMILGLGFMLGSQGIAALIYKFRYAGAPQAS